MHFTLSMNDKKVFSRRGLYRISITPLAIKRDKTNITTLVQRVNEAWFQIHVPTIRWSLMYTSKYLPSHGPSCTPLVSTIRWSLIYTSSTYHQVVPHVHPAQCHRLPSRHSRETNGQPFPTLNVASVGRSTENQKWCTSLETLENTRNTIEPH